MQLQTICKDIWNNFSDDDKDFLKNVVRTKRIPLNMLPKIDYFLKTGVITKVKDDYLIFGNIFQEFISNQISHQKLIYDFNLNQIFYGSKSCGDKFTFQEFKLLVYFIRKNRQVISRDEIAQAIWGKNYVEKYSDWSIDKLISVIRRKLSEIGFPSQNLITLKKRGFSFTNS